MSELPDSPGYRLDQAAKARRAAEDLHDYRARRAMLLIVKGYEKMAEHAALLKTLKLPRDRSDVDR